MRNAWPEVARWINCIAGGAAQRNAKRPDKQANHQRTQYACCTNSLCTNGNDHEYKHEAAYDFSDEIGRDVADGRACAENSKLDTLVFSGFPMG